ncbi:MAG: prepilin-type N-terminal cleavage/methylation domain-containing protein [Rickettsiales bacterium]|nr:prepilin-type N-terminal cleavage/methylation domain-containing protein [Rickettsiales bacterium]
MRNFVKKNHKKAFSLIELSIVIIIVSILVTGALSVSVNSINNAKNKVTKDRINEIYKALGNYMITNKKLPCPAPITDTKSGSSTYGTAASTSLCASTGGVSQSSTSTNLVRGMLPVKTLGLSLEMAEDGFGSKFEYVVDKNYTVASTGTSSDFGTANTANIIINEKQGSSVIAVESSAIFAIISLGGNKSGAYGYDSASRNTLSTDAQELSNTPSSISDDTSYTNTLYASSAGSDVFDDTVFYKNRNSFVSDFDALSVIPCQLTTENLYGTTITWPLSWYDQIAVSTTSCPVGYTSGVSKPTKRCGAFGNWDVVINPCLQ